MEEAGKKMSKTVGSGATGSASHGLSGRGVGSGTMPEIVAANIAIRLLSMPCAHRDVCVGFLRNGAESVNWEKRRGGRMGRCVSTHLYNETLEDCELV